MCCAPIFTCTMQMISNFLIMFIFSELFVRFFYNKCNIHLHLHVILVFFVNGNIFSFEISYVFRGGSRDLEKGALYVGHHGWLAKKILGFRWSKKADITLETISFWQNISISIFKFSPFLSIKSYQFFKIY